MAFVKTTWVNDSDPAITAAQLNRIEQGVADAHTSDVSRAHGHWFADESGVVGPLQVRFAAAVVTPNPAYITQRADRRGFTLVKAGIYLVSWNLLFGDGTMADQRWDMQLWCNGSYADGDARRLTLMERTSGGYADFKFSRAIPYNAGDYLSFFWNYNTYGTYTAGIASAWSQASITYLGAVL